VNERDDLTFALGPVGLAGVALLVLGILFRRRVLGLLGLMGVIADVTRPELGGLRAFNERPTAPDTGASPTL